MFTFSGYLEDYSSESEIEFFLLEKEKSESLELNTLSKYINENYFIEKEGYSFQDFFDMDIDSTIFKGKLNEQDFVCILHSDYHMLFTENGTRLNLESKNAVKHNNSENKINWILSSFNSPSTFSNMGIEKKIFKGGIFDKISSDKSTRYVIKENDEYIAGIQVFNNTIQNIFTSKSHRRKGLAKELIKIAKNDFPDLKHSNNRTTYGDILYRKIKL